MPPSRTRQSSSQSAGSIFSGGGRFPPIIGVIIAATFLASIAGVIGERNGVPILSKGALMPALVMKGEVWRLFTWIFFELSPMGLIFGCLALYWFGRDLAFRFGPTRFAIGYFGGAVLVGAAVVGLSFLWAPLREGVWLGSIPLQEAVIILWASYYPTRKLLLYFVVPLGGRTLVLVTIAGTLLYAVFSGFAALIPHFIAEGLALAFVNLPSPRELWLESKLRGMEQKRRTHLKAVPREPGDDDKPPSGRWLN
jgi:membrane associated rhomboid family serine protease